MSEVDRRCIAFENDHTYLKTTSNIKEDVEFLETNISNVESENDTDIILIENQHNIINKNKIITDTVNTRNIPNADLFLYPDSLNFQLSPNINILQNNFAVQKANTGNKSSIRPIQPKINSSIAVPVAHTQSNILLIPSSNISLNTKLQNVTPKKILDHSLYEEPIIKTANSVKNKIVKDYENGICTIKLTSNLLKRIQSGEKLFMCMECDKVYTKHKDLLDHQIIHDKCDKKVMVSEKEISEKICMDNVKNKTTIDNEKKLDDKVNSIKPPNPIFSSSVKSKKSKMIFQGECIICHSVFTDLEKHIRTVHQNDLNKNNVNHLNYQCYKCDMEFDTKQQFRAHELSAHKPAYTYNCDICFKLFTYREDLETHIVTHYSDNMKYLCPYCDAGFPQSNGLRTHLVKHIGFNSPETSEVSANQIEYSPTRPPEQLDQLFAELNNISENADDVYIEQVDDDDYRVSFSKNNEDNILSPLDSLIDEDQQINIELNKLPLEDTNKIINNQQQATSLVKKRISYTVCRLCMTIVSYSRIGRHMKKKHNNAAPYQCEICNAEFNRKHIMDDHRRKHTNNKPHKCIECSKCFTYKHHLNRHMMIVHNADSLEKPFKCSVCDKAFSFKEYLTLHVNSRHKGKHYMCQICGKSFSTNAALNKHQLCHTDERPFMCEHCGRTFKCKTHCDTHKKNMHPGDLQLSLPPEKFECNLCKKKFSTKVYRDMHLKRHNGQGHLCEICFKLFVSKAHMQRHIKIMHGN